MSIQSFPQVVLPSPANNSGKVLTSDGTTGTWSLPALGLIASSSNINGLSSYAFSSIPQTYKHLKIIGNIYASSLTLSFTSTNQTSFAAGYFGQATGTTWSGGTGATMYLAFGPTASTYGSGFELTIPNYTSVTNKSWHNISGTYGGNTTFMVSGGNMTSTAPITALTFSFGTATGGNISVYGWN